MGILMICDKCDGPITNEVNNRQRTLLRALNISPGDPNGKEILRWDICQKCLDELKTWFVRSSKPVPGEHVEKPPRPPGPPSPPPPPRGNKVA